jgi:sulfite reductase (NADPH) hemoprotein beta-component
MAAHSVEDIKQGSQRLRGSLLESLADPVTAALREADQTLIKYHGSYQQDDRDLRDERRHQKLEPAYSFMIRTRTPGGVVSPQQWLQLDAVATTWAERGLRLTTRQAFQLHGVIKSDLKRTMQAINASLIDTLAACGDVNRNIAVSANPAWAAVHAAMLAQAQSLSAHLLPNSRAYYEIWLDEQKLEGSGEEEEPIYGATYLPRKFKIAFALPPDNDVDVFAQDLGFIAILDDDGQLLGYNVSVGGGMGASHGDAETYPRLGDVIGFIQPGQVIALAEAVVTTQRDWGNRVVRKRARLKYTIDEHGLAAFQTEVERRAGFPLGPARPFAFAHNGDRFGWQASADGRWHLGLRLLSGRIQDQDAAPHLSGLRAIAHLLARAPSAADTAQFRLTPNQNLLIANVNESLRTELDELVARYRLDTHRRSSPTGCRALACVALPTCGLAMAEAERYLPDLLDRMDALLDEHGLGEEAISLRISGCPNGCSRPYLGEIALVGKAPGRYNLMLGADHRGQRLNTLYRENIDEAAIFAALDPLLARFAAEREIGEHFGDFLVRSRLIATKTLAVELIA